MGTLWIKVSNYCSNSNQINKTIYKCTIIDQRPSVKFIRLLHVYINVLLPNLKKKLFTSAYELRKKKKKSSVFITHYIECNLSTERQQARNLGQAVEYAAWTQIV